MRLCIAFLCLALGLPALLQAEAPDRFVATQKIASGGCVVVAEGDREPRSTGSYTVRLYRGPEGDPTADFVAGLVRPRDGTIQKVVLARLGPGEAPALVVIIASVGSGGYLSADAFTVGPRRLRLRASVRDLPQGSDVLARLRSRAD
jgi:hypothetical protein